MITNEEEKTNNALNEVELDREEAMSLCTAIDCSAYDPNVTTGTCIVEDRLWAGWSKDKSSFELHPDFCVESSTTYKYDFAETLALYDALKNRRYDRVTLVCHRWGVDIATYLNV